MVGTSGEGPVTFFSSEGLPVDHRPVIMDTLSRHSSSHEDGHNLSWRIPKYLAFYIQVDAYMYLSVSVL